MHKALADPQNINKEVHPCNPNTRQEFKITLGNMVSLRLKFLSNNSLYLLLTSASFKFSGQRQSEARFFASI